MPSKSSTAKWIDVAKPTALPHKGYLRAPQPAALVRRARLSSPAMTKPPTAPYPPDLSEETPPQAAELGDLLDALLTDVNWANERVHRWEAQRVELRGCRLTGIELAEARVRDVTFEDCRLDLAGIRHARLERVVFRDCRMSECDLYGSMLKDVLFERCELREATFSTCTIERVDFRHCDLAGARGADALRGTRMLWPDIVENAALFALALGIEIVSE
jgi:uncharacterized protein YjbI with pentapeptide repeats